MTDTESLTGAFDSIRDTADRSEVRGMVSSAIRALPKTDEFVSLFERGFDLLDLIEDPVQKRLAVLDFTREIPAAGAFLPLYMRAMEAAVVAADVLDEDHRRTTELIRIAESLPRTAGFEPLRIQAWRLALKLPAEPRNEAPSLEKVAKELPKSSDLAFYRRYTLLGIARRVPLDGPFLDVYREAIELAVSAVPLISEPHYRKYALDFIAEEIREKGGLRDLYVRVMNYSYETALEIQDPFARERALVDLVQVIPLDRDTLTLLNRCLEQALKFFTVKKWMGDIDALDVVDFILSAEELGIKESKKKRFSREQYAKIIGREMVRFKEELNDTRFIVTLKPYTHVWIRPKEMRDAVREVVGHLEALKETFHGAEIERPELVRERHPDGHGRIIHRRETTANECISIDLGATNTVIMRKRPGSEPEAVELPGISAVFEGVWSVPTVLSPGTDIIGAQVTDEYPVVNIKQLLLDGQAQGRTYMERYLRILARNLRKSIPGGGWLPIGSRGPAEVVYITVPVGHVDYRNALKEIAEKTFRGVKIEFIEEPLAAAVGYQVAEKTDKLLLVVDFGGSTLDTMILRLNLDEVHVVSKPDRAKVLGGYDIDVWLSEYLSKRTGVSTPGRSHGLVSAAEQVKIELSKAGEAAFVWDGAEQCRVTREEFEGVLEDHDFYHLIDRTLSNLLRRAGKVGVGIERIDAVLLTGGSSQIPSFKEKIGDVFADLREANRIFDHSPLTAVGMGAAQYGTRDVTDRHLGLSYALRYATGGEERPYSYSIVLEKGEPLPFEKAFRVSPAMKLGPQDEIYLELFEVPERLVRRIWVMEGGIEFIKQELERPDGGELKPLKTLTLRYGKPLDGPVEITLAVDESWRLVVSGEHEPAVEGSITLQ